VSDQDFNFRPQPPRREAKPFEPPPWEREQFDRLARERAEQEAAQKAAALELAERMGQPATDPQAEGTSAGQVAAGTDPVPAQVGPTPSTQPAPVAPATAQTLGSEPVAMIGGKVDEAQLEVLLMGLRAEEAPALNDTWMVAIISAIVTGSVGVVLLVWGLVALAKPNMGPTGVMGGTILMVFGLVFLGIGGWIAFRTLRQRGVL
jgi:hypothetical protein